MALFLLATSAGCAHRAADSEPLVQSGADSEPALAIPDAVAPPVTEVAASVAAAPLAPLAPAASAPMVAEKLPFQDPMPDPRMAAASKANVYASMSSGACRNAIKKRNLPVKSAALAGVATPMRITGPLHGVRFITAPAPSPFGVGDCRLLLALDDFAETLASFSVESVQLDSMARSRARIAGKKKMTSQHAYGLAADIVALTFAGGRRVIVEGNWGAAIGAVPCGPEAAIENRTDDSVLLRNLACAVARQGIFHHMLTPSYDAAHRNHFHFDIKRDTKFWAIR